ncbi:serine protease 55-like [Lacerta agilis]|uniref:serine protease 55-like n=1 Tax=Lacerta agilis TaxID=80427 RepID=UPI001419482B|nr:serine protease 55-like [Lacerta agilis]
MELLLGLSALFQLFLSSTTTFCSIRHPWTHWDKPPSPEEREALEAPWLVNIFGNGKRCQGVVLSSWWVLTAANCFLLMQPSNVEFTGAHGRYSSKTVSQFISHRGFSSWDAPPNNDLGLILLGQPIDLRKPDMWPACVIRKKKPYDTQEECRIIERRYKGEWSVKEIIVHTLVTSECAMQWPDIGKSWNLCVSREASNDTNCMLSVGSPVICRDPVSGHWEVMGVVSQSLHNCTAPILASQILSHLKWLSREGALGAHLNDSEITNGELSSPAITPLYALSETEGELSSTAEESVIFPTQTTTQTTVSSHNSSSKESCKFYNIHNKTVPPRDHNTPCNTYNYQTLPIFIIFNNWTDIYNTQRNIFCSVFHT